MTPMERLRWAVAPVESRGAKILWGGVALMVAAGGVLMLFEAPPLAGAVLYLAMVGGWGIAACGMVGYLRWYFRQAAADLQDEFRRRPDK